MFPVFPTVKPSGADLGLYMVLIGPPLVIKLYSERRKEGHVLFNVALIIFYLRLYGEIATVETHCRHYIGYTFRLAARDLLYAPFHRHDSTYHGLG